MQELSKRNLQVKENEYILFLNRKGIMSWENITKVSKKAIELENKYKNYQSISDDEEPIEVTDNDNPFDYANEDTSDLEKDEAILRDIYIKFYWIALYENHKLPLNEVKEIFNEAEEEYGIEQLVQLANEMIEDVNKNKYGSKELKKLTALNQTK